MPRSPRSLLAGLHRWLPRRADWHAEPPPPGADGRVALGLGLLALGVYAAFAGDRLLGPSPYPHHLAFARAYLQGELGLASPLYELIEHGGRHYNPQGPLPALLLTPWVLLFGAHASDVAFGVLLSAATVGLFHLALCRIAARAPGVPRAACAGFSLVFAFGSFLWPYAANGMFWYLNQLVAVACVVVSLWAWFDPAARARTGALAGLALGAGFLARYHVPLLGAVFAVDALLDRRRPPGARARRLAWAGAGLAVGLAAFAWHNQARFGHPLTTGYARFQGEHLWHINRLGPRLANVFLSFPVWFERAPHLRIPLNGLSLLLTLPPLVLLARQRLDSGPAKALAFGALPTFLFLMGYATNGAVQWGYRYLLELLPATVALLCLGWPQVRRRRAALALILLGVAVNAVGAAVFWRFGQAAWTQITLVGG